MFEAIGILVSIVIVGYILLSFMDKKRSEESELRILIFNSDTCYRILQRMAAKSGRTLTNPNQIIITDELRKIINQPEETVRALENIKEKARYAQEQEILNKEREKIQFKYLEEIVEMFGNKRELNKDYIFTFIENNFPKYSDKPLELLKIWRSNFLIEKCSWNKNYVLGVLSLGFEERKKWLEANNITLEPPSKEEEEFYIENGLPF